MSTSEVGSSPDTATGGQGPPGPDVILRNGSAPEVPPRPVRAFISPFIFDYGSSAPHITFDERKAAVTALIGLLWGGADERRTRRRSRGPEWR
ncbi:hypothetical protein GCM10010140_57420 [Streptosporangium pseudovulgare]|uniref:Uncharacterized protein n=1 Tax=Streptosporangium pseudovulgare TaxID=35765 RepID=A0ABQ2R8R5_9ACTN|nr:hypothetical protein GCM10010140_57420 [Streptosporangium pseudovulgare]